MKGLELARQYYLRYGTELLARFPGHRHRIAAGLAGDGSECLGYDDGMSRDHDWGPGFCLWLSAIDFDAIGASLQEAYAALPASFAGHRRQTSAWGGGRVGVMATDAFYRRFLGRAAGPGTAIEWLKTPDSALAACTSGEVFEDPLGEFSAVRARLLGYYPRDVHLAKIAARCMWAGQAGQYNLPRCSARGELFAAQYTETKFAAEAMNLVFLLQRRYAPFYKWLHRGVADLGALGARVHGLVAELAGGVGTQRNSAVVEELCEVLIAALIGQGLSDSTSGLLVEHGLAVHARITDPELRRLDVWAG